MAFSPKELKAIDLFMKSNNCIVQLSIRPMIRFMDHDTKKITEHTISFLVGEYNKKVKLEQIDKRRKVAQEKRQSQRTSSYSGQYQNLV